MHKIIARVLFIPTLLWNVLLGRILRVRNWWDRVDDHLIVGALPFRSDVPALSAAGVKAVVNTCDEYAGPVEAYRQAGIEQMRVPTTDFTPPTLEAIQHAVAFMDDHMADGGTVYVHCKAGRGRSATVALCWLVHAKGMTPEQAQTLLQEKRPHVNRKLDQREVVRQFYDACQA